MTAPERISASLAFAKWTKTQGAKWNLGAMWEDGKFVKFMAPDTDTAWLAFSAAWNRRADLHDAALAAAKAEGIRWQPIETAPKDGPVLLYYARREWRDMRGTIQDLGPLRGVVERTDVAFCENGDICEVGTGHSVFEDWRGDENTPTHWMPLPAPPEAAP